MNYLRVSKDRRYAFIEIQSSMVIIMDILVFEYHGMEV